MYALPHVFNLLVILSLIVTTLGLTSLGLLSANTAGTTATEGRGQAEVDVLLGVETDHEGGDVDGLLADTDVALADQNTGVVDGLGEAELEDAGLETALQEIFDLKSQDVIELHAGFVEHTDTDETANEGIAFEETLGVTLIEGKKLTVDTKQLVHNCQRKVYSETWENSTYRAARRILERVKPTLQTSRLLRRPYSPTSFNSESLYYIRVSFLHKRLKQSQAHVHWPVTTDNRAAS